MDDRPLVVFSDLDGIFDDPAAASFASGAKALAALAREHVPLVLCSNKTRAEIEQISRGLCVTHPFICERGAAVFIPKGYLGFVVPNGREVAGYEVVEFGRDYATVVGLLHETAARLGIAVTGFNEMSVDEVAHECGISLLQARLAKLREYGELFRILDPHPSARLRLFRGLHAARLLCGAGHRYDHVGAAVDHRMGVDLLCDLYRRARGGVTSVGLSEPSDDGNLLQVVDIPVLIGPHPQITGQRARRIETIVAAQVKNVETWAETIVDVVRKSRRVPSGVDV